jgi:chromosome partitioning protein
MTRRAFAVANQKGGVGKTTTTINLAAALGALEQRVLLIDADPQGNATRGLGASAGTPHLYHVLAGDATLEQAVRPSGFPYLDLLATGRDLVGVEVESVGQADWEHRLRDLVVRRSDHDIVLIDCPPSLGHLTVMALSAADQVLVPMQCEYYALEGISELVSTIRRVQAGPNPELALGGVLLTMYDDRTRLSKEVADEVRRHFGQLVFQSIVPRSIRLAEAPSHGLPIFQYDIKSKGAEAYLALAQELMTRNPSS